jgi:hypothetical protein
VQHPAEHAVEVLGRIEAILLVERNDDFAVGVGLEWVWLGELLAEDLVVVDLGSV